MTLETMQKQIAQHWQELLKEKTGFIVSGMVAEDGQAVVRLIQNYDDGTQQIIEMLAHSACDIADDIKMAAGQALEQKRQMNYPNCGEKEMRQCPCCLSISHYRHNNQLFCHQCKYLSPTTRKYKIAQREANR